MDRSPLFERGCSLDRRRGLRLLGFGGLRPFAVHSCLFYSPSELYPIELLQHELSLFEDWPLAPIVIDGSRLLSDYSVPSS